MNFVAHIDIMPHEELLDPQGKAVLKNLSNIEVHGVDNVRIGKHVRMEIQAESEEQAKEVVEKTCQKLLVNMIVEQYAFRLEKA